METTPQPQQDFVLDFPAEYLAGLKAHDGAPQPLPPPGDYKLKITVLTAKTGEGKTYSMLVVANVIVEAYDQRNAEAVGMTVESTYAGDRGAPEMMQRRLKHFLSAVGYQPQPGGKGLQSKELVGRAYDAGLVWETSAGKPDPRSGIPRQFTNARVRYERAAGTPAPQHANVLLDSRAAVIYRLGANENVPEHIAAQVSASVGSGDTGQPTTGVPWAQPGSNGASGAPAGNTVVGTPPNVPPSWLPEEALTDPGLRGQVMTFRAHIALGTANAQLCRDQLVAGGINPEGPIDATVISDDAIKTQYAAKIAPPVVVAPLVSTMPKLGNLPTLNIGTRK